MYDRLYHNVAAIIPSHNENGWQKVPVKKHQILIFSQRRQFFALDMTQARLDNTGMEQVCVPVGCFMIGSNKDDAESARMDAKSIRL